MDNNEYNEIIEELKKVNETLIQSNIKLNKTNKFFIVLIVLFAIIVILKAFYGI